MKVIAFMNSFWVGEEEGMSGSDRRLLEVAKWWESHGVDFEILTSERGFEACQKEGLGDFARVTAPAWVDRLGIIPSYLIRVVRALLMVPKFKSDLVAYASSDFLTDVLPALSVKVLNKKSVWIALSHHVIEGRLVSGLAQRISFILIRKFSDRLIVPSFTTRETLLSLGFVEKKIFVIPNGLDVGFISRIASFKARLDACFLARLKPSKGIYDLPKIWKLVVQSVPDAQLVVLGGGESREVRRLHDAFMETGVIEKVQLLGFVSEEEKYRTLKSSRIFIFPSREEGFGIAVLEAMACGLPVVAWDLPVYREIFEEGMVRIPLEDCESFAAAVVELLGDEKKRIKMGQEAKSLAQGYNWDGVAEKEWEVITEVVL